MSLYLPPLQIECAAAQPKVPTRKPSTGEMVSESPEDRIISRIANFPTLVPSFFGRPSVSTIAQQ